MIARRARLAALCALAACQGRPAPAPELAPDQVATVLGNDMFEKLLAIDRIEDGARHEYAPLLWSVMEDRDRPAEERARAAGALLGLGYAAGQRFCIAVLGANLVEFADRDREHGLPRSERWAFAREIAIDAIGRRLAARGVAVPRYDVNLGAPDLAAATAAVAAALASAGPLRPGLSEAQLAARIPVRGPSGITEATWAEYRARCLEAAER